MNENGAIGVTQTDTENCAGQWVRQQMEQPGGRATSINTGHNTLHLHRVLICSSRPPFDS